MTTTDTSSVLSDDDYDVISNPGQRSLESSLTDLKIDQVQSATEIYEPPPSKAAQDKFESVSYTPANVQEYVRKSLGTNAPTQFDETIVRVYVDGIFGRFNVGDALQLRQAKLSFPCVKLIVGVFSDGLCNLYGYPPSLPHVERCEIVRHCRWVDEVVHDAPWQLDDQFIKRRKIDYVALSEGTSVDPACDKARLKGYDDMKALGKVILTRRVGGVTVLPSPAPSPAFERPPSPRVPLVLPPPPLPPVGIYPTSPPIEEDTPDAYAHMDIYGIGI